MTDDVSLQSRIEELTGGTVVAMRRQVRHRPAWFVDVERDGVGFEVYVRGDRRSDVQPFPDLRREAEILRVLHAAGIPTPAVLGMCDEPNAIIMESVPGTRDVGDAPTDQHRRTVAERYIEVLAAMHQLPVERFSAIGLAVPVGSEAISLAGLDAYLPLYQRHKARPEPLIELAIGWLRANVPPHREAPCFVAFDAGQFLFDDSGLTAIFDLEFAMIGDPYADLASMALREPTEPMGSDISDLCHLYATRVGETLDIDLLRFHQVVFATVSCMQFVGALAHPAPGDPHDVYVMWDLYLRRSLILLLADRFDVDVSSPDDVDQAVSMGADPLASMVQDAIRQIPKSDGQVSAKRSTAIRLAQYRDVMASAGAALDERYLTEVEVATGLCGRDRDQVDAELEILGGSGHNTQRQMVFTLLARDFERRRLAGRSAPLGQAADHARLAEIR